MRAFLTFHKNLKVLVNQALLVLLLLVDGISIVSAFPLTFSWMATSGRAPSIPRIP